MSGTLSQEQRNRCQASLIQQLIWLPSKVSTVKVARVRNMTFCQESSLEKRTTRVMTTSRHLTATLRFKAKWSVTKSALPWPAVPTWIISMWTITCPQAPSRKTSYYSTKRMCTASSASPSRTRSWRSIQSRLQATALTSYWIIFNSVAPHSPPATVQIKSHGSISVNPMSSRWRTQRSLKASMTTGGPCRWRASG